MSAPKLLVKNHDGSTEELVLSTGTAVSMGSMGGITIAGSSLVSPYYDTQQIQELEELRKQHELDAKAAAIKQFKSASPRDRDALINTLRSQKLMREMEVAITSHPRCERLLELDYHRLRVINTNIRVYNYMSDQFSWGLGGLTIDCLEKAHMEALIDEQLRE